MACLIPAVTTPIVNLWIVQKSWFLSYMYTVSLLWILAHIYFLMES